MAEGQWSGTVPKHRLDVLHQLRHIFRDFGGVRKFGINNGSSVNRFLFTCWDRNMIVEIFPDTFFHDFKSDIFIVEYELAEDLSLFKAFDELLKPPAADIRFLLNEGSNVLSLLKDVEGFPAVHKDIKLKFRELKPRPSMVVSLSNVYVEPKSSTLLYDFLKQAKRHEIAEIAFGGKHCHVSLGCLHPKAEGPSFRAVANISLNAVRRNRLVPPQPVWSLDISLLRRLYKVFLPTLKPLIYF
ncbi:hypothetical protein MKW92_043367, partial [Papaver armeniacum]